MIKFQQVVGQRGTRGGGVETIRHDVDNIIRDGQLIGQIGRFNNAGIILLVDCDADMRAQLQKEIIEARTAEGEFTVNPNRLSFQPSGRMVDQYVREQQAAGNVASEEELDTPEDAV